MRRHLSTYEFPFSIKRASALKKNALSVIYALFVALYALPLLLGSPAALVYCDDSFPFLGLSLKLLSGRKVVIRLGDLQTGYILQGSGHESLFRLVHFLEIAYWKLVDGTIPISDAFRDYVIKSGVRPARCVVVPECVDTELFRPGLEREELLPRRRRIRLMYHGVIEPQKGLELVMNHFEKFAKNGGDVELVIVGDGSLRAGLLRRYSKLIEGGYLTFTGWQKLSNLPFLIAQSDIGLVSRRRELANEFVLSASMLQYLASGKPVLAPYFRTIRQTVESANCGVLFDPSSEKEFIASLTMIASDSGLRDSFSANARGIAVSRFSADIVASKLLSALISFSWQESGIG